MKNWLLSFLFLTTTFFALGQDEYLVIFTQDTSVNFADKHFTDSYLKPIRTFAADNNLKLIERKAEEGVFEQTTYTPAIYFVNKLNFSQYKGRYTETNRLFNFIRSAYSIPKKDNNITMKDVFTSKEGNTDYIYPIKVTDIKGYESEKTTLYINLINDEIRKGIEGIEYHKGIELPYESRKYYLDFYPYITNKKLYLTTKVFTEFNCKKPIYHSTEPFSGKLKDYVSIIKTAKQTMLSGIKSEIQIGTKGDAHTPLKKDNIILSLNDLGISIEKSSSNQDQPFPTSISPEWIFSSAVNDNTPLLQFQVPNTIYTGEIKELAAKLNLLNMTGYATGNITSLTLGDYGLDESVLGRVLADKFNTSTISFKEIIKGKEQKITAFEDYEYLIKCDFTFVGQTVEEEIILTLTPFIKNSELYLQCQSTYDIQLKRQFGIDSGVGESYEEDTVEFYINFILKSKQK